ncbi:hydrogenase small subunit [Thiocystis violascens]|uniref:hydrogenase (acceptor) n=1 Tax=Thiocystis violascens (strain ATCC 17096 / DSM 198 / 6111) TaxID=765911 RepID=I3Y8K4_THIV6|nr:hydrogenase small subunit [Thiocystis violascens]AFL73322.1 hydrogenase (NiFe) small subunit HydA [Thiocystis violascens DSM 198]
MAKETTLGDLLRSQGVSRRAFLQFCTTTATMMALPAAVIPSMARALEQARRPSVIWLSFQECTGCTEALLRSHAPSIESLIFDFISLDYHHTLQAASGDAAEKAREQAMHEHAGEYLLLVDGSIPTLKGTSTIAGINNLDMLMEGAAGAAAILAVGTCAAYGGLPKAAPNPTGARSVEELITDKPIVNLSGCPPIPLAITGVIAHYLTMGALPEVDHLKRPLAFYGENVHDRCYRRPFYDRGLFAETFDDEGARKGWCLYKLGCKAPETYNACATIKWNQGVSFPIQSGHGCIGCSEPNFWDKGGIYESVPMAQFGSGPKIAVAGAVGVVAGAGAALLARTKKHKKEAELHADE